MSGLSAITSSCGGDGDLLGRGGDGGDGGGLTTFLEFALALRKMGAIFSSSVGGADDRLDESDPDMLRGDVKYYYLYKQHERGSCVALRDLGKCFSDSFRVRAGALRNDHMRHSPDL